MLVALGPVYPGPVAPVVARGSLAAAVVIGAVMLAPSVPSRWRDLRRTVRRARVGLMIVAAAAALTIIKVGLHDVTPGPVLPAPARWVSATVVVLAAALLLLRDDRTSDS